MTPPGRRPGGQFFLSPGGQFNVSSDTKAGFREAALRAAEAGRVCKPGRGSGPGQRNVNQRKAAGPHQQPANKRVSNPPVARVRACQSGNDATHSGVQGPVAPSNAPRRGMKGYPVSLPFLAATLLSPKMGHQRVSRYPFFPRRDPSMPRFGAREVGRYPPLPRADPRLPHAGAWKGRGYPPEGVHAPPMALGDPREGGGDPPDALRHRRLLPRKPRPAAFVVSSAAHHPSRAP